MSDLKVFSLLDGPWGEAVVKYLSIPLCSVFEKRFEDGEDYARSMENVRGKDVYVLCRLHSDYDLGVGDKLCKLLIFIGSLRDASAEKITLLIPYLPFSRQDRKTESRAPLSLKYLAIQMESLGVDRIMTLDVHNLAAYQNAFRIPCDNLEVRKTLIERFIGLISNNHINYHSLTVLSPDSGGMHRARLFRGSLEKMLSKLLKEPVNVELAYFDKERKNNTIDGGRIVGNIKDRQIVIIDDMIVTGSTICLSSKSVKEDGGFLLAIIATHGLFVGNTTDNLKNVPHIIVSDSIPLFRSQIVPDLLKRIQVVKTEELFATAIRRNHDHDSISELFEEK